MPASPSTARVINDRLALRLLQQRGPLTAGQLKQLTGLSRPTVADLVDRLTAAGLITVVGESDQQRRGPNARLYGIAADRAQLAALDVRTDGVTVTVADLLGRELTRAAAPIATDTATGPAVEQAVALVERAVRGARAERLHTLTVGAPGLIDPATGELRDSSGLPVWHRRLVGVLQHRLPGTRVVVENETNLAALAEQRDGAARDRDTFVLLWLGGGTGAAVILDGTLRRGASGGAGEIGFLPVPGTSGLPSATDCEGGFHQLASAPAVMDLAAEHRIAGHAFDKPQARGAADAAGLVGHAVRLAAGQARAEADGTAPGGPPEADGTGNAARFLEALADRLALGVASVAAVLDPGCVVLGGEIGQAGGDALAARVEERVARLSPLRTEVRASVLGGAAVLRGALLTARDSAQEDLATPPGVDPDSSSGQGG
ncbi:ROK family transcriptional regulator [Streptomyces sp. WAC00469]|uniref:ROK family transcriptional regulator n=1 Tax=Streptomyces sp. WAC00469 TaxID=2487415 RepID=UPI000F743006|nr:ROK family transcriptional regulator [Streptomyces sp. WAC00469]RSS08793.1 ROK family transcriptional regulator [Streptomyces sp. WAC00469]